MTEEFRQQVIMLRDDNRLGDVVGEGNRRGARLIGIQENEDKSCEVYWYVPENIDLSDLSDPQ